MSIINRFIALLLATLALLAATAAPAHAGVDVNRASQAELETIKGIGPGLSGKILAAREQGAFKDWTDLQERVSGIGQGNSAKFSQAGLTVAGSGYSAAPEAAARAGKTTAQAERPARAEKADKADKPEKATRAAKADATRP